MSKTLGGCVWVRNAVEYDYCIAESVRGMKELCDQVVVLDVGSTDGTTELVKSLEDEKTTGVYLGRAEWGRVGGKERIAYYQNLAMSFLTTDYYCISQADEVFHQDSFNTIRRAIETGSEAYMVTRVNLWGSPYKKLTVPLNRMPCSPQVIRIAKTCYLSVDDGENIASGEVNMDYVDDIRLYHFGFVRNKNVMKDKIINMQTGVFEMSDYDVKLKDQKVFDWRAWFSEDDLAPIDEELPIFSQQWAKQRDTINSK
jgi:glycosyltransferase involved in cell wall biosynthesis